MNNEKKKNVQYAQDTRCSPFHSLFDLCIVEDDGGTLPSQFQGDDFQVGLSSCLENLPAGQCASGERNFFNKWMLANRLSDGVAFWFIFRSLW